MMSDIDRPARRRLLAGVLLAAAAAFTAPAVQAFPDKPIRLYVPFPPGGPTDIVARPLAQLVEESLGQPVVVENRGGAGGSIAAELVARSAPDGHTLLMGTVGTNAINGTLYRKLPHDPVRDFTPIALVASAPVAVVVHPDTPWRSMKELIDDARARPGQIAFGSAGNGTPGHLTGVLFTTAAGVKLQHVPYKGSAPAKTDLLGNQIPMMFDPLQSVIKHVRAGRLRALAISGKTRSPVLPEVPTLAESGLEGFQTTAWWAVFGPAGIPADVAAKLRTAIERAAASEAYKNRLGDLGVQPQAEPIDLGAFQKAEVAKWGDAVRQSGAAVD